MIRHNNENPEIILFDCDICGKVFDCQSNLKNHLSHSKMCMSDDNYKPFPCMQCDKSYKNKKGLTDHMKEYHELLKPFKCDICEKQFISKVKLKRHKWIHNADDAFSCKICNQTFKAKSYVRTHMKNMHPGVVMEKEEKAVEPKVPDPEEEKLRTCDECGKVFRTLFQLNKHLTIHTGEKSFLCDICSKSFRTKKDLGQHKISHSEGRDIACDECGNMFRHRNHLSKHIKRVHTSKKNYACDECGKTYKTSSGLKDHYRIHTGETPYSCDLCGDSFRTWEIWNGHKMKHKKLLQIKD